MRDPSRPARHVLLALGLVVPVLFLAALILSSFLHRYAPALVHVILAVGVMPLIMAAMIYFTPVLTHSRAPSWPVLALPVLALTAGVAAAAALFWRRDLIMVPALTAMFAAAALLGWIGWRARTMLGRPHPGLNWYRLALASLLLGLLAISVAAFWPEHWSALRRFHLHINMYGFIGLTAVGTLRVLLPTVAGYTDPATRPRLQRDLYPMALGALLMAAGSAWWAWLVWPGLALWLVPVGRFAVPLVTTWRQAVWGWHRPATALALAVTGLVIVLFAGGLHGARAMQADVVMPLFFYLFLFPLVTGAISYLLPVWVWPARNTESYESAVRRLARGSGVRALVFYMAGGMAWAGMPGAVYLAVAAMAVFLTRAIWALSARFSTPA